MLDIIRNIISVFSTFTVITTVAMIITHRFLIIINHKKQLSKKQERILVYCGIALALILLPFYYLPA